eukprot:PhF_6_TR40626/c1_g2_i9/m.60965
MQRLPRDCVNHILSYCPQSTVSLAYLVCRSWYHAVDRYVCLGDKFYNLPEGINKVQQPRWFPSSSLPTLRNNEHFHRTEVLYVMVMEAASCIFIPDSLKEIHVTILSTLKQVPSVKFVSVVVDMVECESVSQWSSFRSLQKINFGGWKSLLDDCLHGLETLPRLEELILCETSVRDVSLLKVCPLLRKLFLSCCSNLDDAGLHGLEGIPTLEELNISSTNISDVSHLSGCRALRKLNLSRC